MVPLKYSAVHESEINLLACTASILINSRNNWSQTVKTLKRERDCFIKREVKETFDDYYAFRGMKKAKRICFHFSLKSTQIGVGIWERERERERKGKKLFEHHTIVQQQQPTTKFLHLSSTQTCLFIFLLHPSLHHFKFFPLSNTFGKTNRG